MKYKDSSFITKLFVMALFLYMTVVAVSFITNFVELDILHSLENVVGEPDDSIMLAAEASDERQLFMTRIRIATMLATFLVLLFWIHRMNANARHFSASDMKYTPGWSVGWFFVPIANMWKPYFVMEEIWKVSENPADWQVRSRPVGPQVWWLTFVLSAISKDLSARIAERADGLDDYIVSNLVSQASLALDAIYILVLLWLIRRIYSMQNLRYREMIQGSSRVVAD